MISRQAQLLLEWAFGLTCFSLSIVVAMLCAAVIVAGLAGNSGGGE